MGWSKLFNQSDENSDAAGAELLVVLESETARPGATVNGTVYVNIPEEDLDCEKHYRTLNVEVIGMEKSRLVKYEYQLVTATGIGASYSREVRYRDTRTFLSGWAMLDEAPGRQRGRRAYPIQFQIPEIAPPSFYMEIEGNKAYTAYMATAVLHKSGVKSKLQHCVEFEVLHNPEDPPEQETNTVEATHKIGGFGGMGGEEAVCQLTHQACLVAGVSSPLFCKVSTSYSRALVLSVKLKRYLECWAMSEEEEEGETVWEHRRDLVPDQEGNLVATINIDFPPDEEPDNIEADLFNLTHELEVVIQRKAGVMGRKLKQYLPVTVAPSQELIAGDVAEEEHASLVEPMLDCWAASDERQLTVMELLFQHYQGGSSSSEEESSSDDEDDQKRQCIPTVPLKENMQHF